MESSKRPPDSAWIRSSSRRLVRKNTIPNTPGPDYNFRFLSLSTEIKLLICKYLSTDDICRLSIVSQDYKKFVDKYFVCKQICLPDDIQGCYDTQGRYILSLEVDFNCRAELDKEGIWSPVSPVTRAKCVEAIKMLNLAQLKEVVLKTDFTVQWLDLPTEELCAWYTEISMIVFKSAPCLQYVDFTLLRCERSLRIMEILANNSCCLKHVTLRNPPQMGSLSMVLNLLNSHQTFFSYSLLQLVGKLLEKSNITSLHLLDFDILEYEESSWGDPFEDRLPLEIYVENPRALKSNTLEELVLQFACIPQPLEDSRAMLSELVCPKLTRFKVRFAENHSVCINHFSLVAPGLVLGLVRNSPNCKHFNRKYIGGGAKPINVD